MPWRVCCSGLSGWWHGVVERNGALQLAFGLFFAAASGRWRLASCLLVIQLLGLVMMILVYVELLKRKAWDIYPLLSVAVNVLYRVAILADFVFAFFYVRKYGFVANVGMAFPHPPAQAGFLPDSRPMYPDSGRPRCASLRPDIQDTAMTVQDSEGLHDPAEEEIYQGQETATTRKPTPPGEINPQRKSKVHLAVNCFAVIWLVLIPILWGLTYRSSPRLFRLDQDQHLVIICIYALWFDFFLGIAADIVMVLMFVSLTQNVVDEISSAEKALSSPAVLHNITFPSERRSLVSKSSEVVRRLKQSTSAWLETMSFWFALHVTCFLIMAIVQVVLLVAGYQSRTDPWVDGTFNPTIAISTVVPVVCASRVTRRWDTMVEEVLTSDQWLPDNWQEHMYLRQFLEHSKGGFFVFGIRVRGSRFLPIITVCISIFGAFQHFN